MRHNEAHPQAGEFIKVNLGGDIHTYHLEDWWDRVSGGSWMDANGNPAALQYAFRSGRLGLPIDDEVVYGKIGAFGHLVHVSEILTED